MSSVSLKQRKDKRTHAQIRKCILEVLKDGEGHRYGDLERHVNTNWKTIRNHCKELIFFGVVTISESEVRLTEYGRSLSTKLAKTIKNRVMCVRN